MSLLSSSNEEKVQWHGHNVRSADGSYFNLPADADIKKYFPVHRPHKNHYPKSLVFMAANAFTGQPIALECGGYNTSEHDHLKQVLERFKPGDITILDRYFHSYPLIEEFFKRDQFFIIRAKIVPSKNSLASQLKRSKKKQITVKVKIGDQLRRLRIIEAGSQKRRMVLITNLTDKRKYARREVTALYKKRWSIETSFLRMKQTLGSQNWHTKKAKGIKLELLAHCLALSLLAAQTFLANRKLRTARLVRVNFKAAKLIFCTCLILPIGKTRLLQWLSCCVVDVQPGRSYPRFSYQPANRWTGKRRPSKRRLSKESRKKGYWKEAR